MDRKLLRPIKWAFLFESLYTGTSALSRVLRETESELEDMMKYVDERTKSMNFKAGKYFRK